MEAVIRDDQGQIRQVIGLNPKTFKTVAVGDFTVTVK